MGATQVQVKFSGSTNWNGNELEWSRWRIDWSCFNRLHLNGLALPPLLCGRFACCSQVVPEAFERACNIRSYIDRGGNGTVQLDAGAPSESVPSWSLIGRPFEYGASINHRRLVIFIQLIVRDPL